MRFKIALFSLLVVIIGFSPLTSLLLSAGAMMNHVSAFAAPQQAAPTLTSEQLAVIQAINTLLLSDDEATDTLVLLYINADNDLAQYIPDLVRKVHIGATNPEVATSMVLDWPGANNSHRYRLDNRGASTCDFQTNFTCGGRYVAGQSVKDFPEDMGDPANLSKFIKEALAEYPDAKRVALALVGHGGGWSPNLLAGQPQGHGGQPGDDDQKIGGLLWDDYAGPGPGSSLSTLDLHVALRDAQATTGRKIDLLYLDACLMGMWEVAGEVHNEVNYLLASESWTFTAFAYDEHLLGIRNTQSMAQIGQAWLQSKASNLRRDRYPFTYALIDLTQLPTVTASIDTLAQSLTTVAATPAGRTQIRSAFVASDCFDSNADHIINRNNPAAGKLDNYCDLASFAVQLQKHFTDTVNLVSAAQGVQGALAKSVVNTDNSDCAAPGNYSPIPWCWQKLGGLSIYTPLGEDDWKRGLYSQLQVANDTHWNEFLDQYWIGASTPVTPTCPTGGCPLPGGPLQITYSSYLPIVQR